MKFEKIPSQNELNWGHVRDWEKMRTFQHDFKIVGVNWTGEHPDISGKYFCDLLMKGASVREPYNRNYAIDCKRFLGTLSDHVLIDHSAFWNREDNSVMFTTMPYYPLDLAMEKFNEWSQRCSFPDSIKMRQLDDKYRFRPNGLIMLEIYYEEE